MNVARPKVRKVFSEKIASYTEHTRSQAVRKVEKDAEVEQWVNRNPEEQQQQFDNRRKITAGDLKRKRANKGVPVEENQQIIRAAMEEARPQVAHIFNQQARPKNKVHLSTVNNAFEKDSL
jgi:hypothetical protein